LPPFDDRVARLQERGEIVDDFARQRGRHHQPDRARAVELVDEILQRVRPDGALALELVDRAEVDVVDDAFVAFAQEPAHDVGAHPAEADHSELHGVNLRWLAFLGQG
jgi:hypothetical protein